MRLRNRVAIVTGACRGIGSAIAVSLASEGAIVVLTGRDVAQCGELIASLELDRELLRIAQVDVTQKAQIVQAVDNCIEEWGRIDILVNNAGVPGVEKVSEVTDELWDIVFNVNVRGVFWFIQAVIPQMIHQGWGRIVNISSQTGKVGQSYNSVYSASKFAVIGLTQALAAELARFNITINAVCPGDIATAMLLESIRKYSSIIGTAPEDHLNSLVTRIPLGRLGEPEDVAGAVMFLASEEAAYITGASIPVTGGQTMF